MPPRAKKNTSEFGFMCLDICENGQTDGNNGDSGHS